MSIKKKEAGLVELQKLNVDKFMGEGITFRRVTIGYSYTSLKKEEVRFEWIMAIDKRRKDDISLSFERKTSVRYHDDFDYVKNDMLNNRRGSFTIQQRDAFNALPRGKRYSSPDEKEDFSLFEMSREKDSPYYDMGMLTKDMKMSEDEVISLSKKEYRDICRREYNEITSSFQKFIDLIPPLVIGGEG